MPMLLEIFEERLNVCRQVAHRLIQSVRGQQGGAQVGKFIADMLGRWKASAA